MTESVHIFFHNMCTQSNDDNMIYTDSERPTVTHNHNHAKLLTHVPSSSSLATPSSHPRNNASSPSEDNISAYRSDDASQASASRMIL